MGRHDDPKYATTDGQPPTPGLEDASAPKPVDSSGQHGAYWILTEAERSKGFVRPVRRSYKHTVCGSITTMGMAIAETYARDPKFYGATFCVRCAAHFTVDQFTWEPDGGILGS